MRPTGHVNVCSVSDTLLYLQLNWVKKLPQARLNDLKRWIFLISQSFWQNSVEKVVNCVSRPEGAGTLAGKRLDE